MKRFAAPFLVALIAAAGARSAAPPSAPPKPVLEAASLGSTERVHRFGGTWLASQPSKDDLRLASEIGIRTVVNLRKPAEIDWDEKAAVEALGMAYESFGFQQPEELTDAVFDGALRALAPAAGAPILLHCGSANRVGAIWLAHRVLDDGLAYGDALVEAETVGLKNPAFREKAKDYIERSSAGRSR